MLFIISYWFEITKLQNILFFYHHLCCLNDFFLFNNIYLERVVFLIHKLIIKTFIIFEIKLYPEYTNNYLVFIKFQILFQIFK